ncbi:putative ATPase and membrane protein [Parvularcula bermudensis HTCC2503]|uniref:Putative ATPase and membrane protein n=1 Tax=Parvularcula bermudensis (strain ATCC BAA-594 / HTCC2503 / KCTC 12087) TaxID=314260 RepID=E0TGM5_PARBH|nr:ATP-binding protein [Parvularcula bermudensis]ADM10157.1 putative ATPase and membrane protein [Parvularcula bermudensis HTCC2503]
MSSLLFSGQPGEVGFIQTEPHRRAVAHVLQGIHQGAGAVLLTGEKQVGKSAVFVSAMAQAQAANPSIIAIILSAYDIERKGVMPVVRTALEGRGVSMSDGLEGALASLRASGRLLRLLIDNADALSEGSLEDLYDMMKAEEGAVGAALQVTFAGSASLRRLLYKNEFEPMRRVISSSFHMSPLTEKEMLLWLQDSLGEAGLGTIAIEQEGLERLMATTHGFPGAAIPAFRLAVAKVRREDRSVIMADDMPDPLAEESGAVVTAQETAAEPEAEIQAFDSAVPDDTPAETVAPAAPDAAFPSEGETTEDDEETTFMSLNSRLEQLSQPGEEAQQAGTDEEATETETPLEKAQAASPAVETAEPAALETEDTTPLPLPETGAQETSMPETAAPVRDRAADMAAIDAYVTDAVERIAALKTSLTQLRDKAEQLEEKHFASRERFTARLRGLHDKIEQVASGD